MTRFFAVFVILLGGVVSCAPGARQDEMTERQVFGTLCAAEMEHHYLRSYALTPKGKTGAVPRERVEAGAKTLSAQFCGCMSGWLAKSAESNASGTTSAIFAPMNEFIRDHQSLPDDPGTKRRNPEFPSALFVAAKVCGKPVVVFPTKWLFRQG